MLPLVPIFLPTQRDQLAMRGVATRSHVTSWAWHLPRAEIMSQDEIMSQAKAMSQAMTMSPAKTMSQAMTMSQAKNIWQAWPDTLAYNYVARDYVTSWDNASSL